MQNLQRGRDDGISQADSQTNWVAAHPSSGVHLGSWASGHWSLHLSTSCTANKAASGSKSALNVRHRGESCFCFLRLAPRLPEHLLEMPGQSGRFLLLDAETNEPVWSATPFFVWSKLCHWVILCHDTLVQEATWGCLFLMSSPLLLCLWEQLGGNSDTMKVWIAVTHTTGNVLGGGT